MVVGGPRRVTFAVVAVLCLAVAAPASAAPQLLPARTIGPAASQTAVAVDRAGNAIAVWTETRPIEGNTETIVKSAYHPVGGDWTAAQEISDPANRLSNASAPGVAFDGAGNAVAVWLRGAERGPAVETATRSAAAGWLPPEALSGGGSTRPLLAVDPSGRVTVAWEEISSPGGDAAVIAATRPPGGTFSLETLTGEGDRSELGAVAADPSGRAAVVWHEANTDRVYGRVRQLSGAWQGAKLLGQDAEQPSVTFDGAGNAVAVWIQDGAGQVVSAVWSVASESWDPPVPASPPGQTGLVTPQVTVDSTGGTVVVYGQSPGSGTPPDVVNAVTKPPGGAPFGDPLPISIPNVPVTAPLLAPLTGGRVLAVWKETDHPNPLRAAVRTPGAWGAPARVTDEGEDVNGLPSLSSDAAGNALIGWSNGDARVAPFDGAGPTLNVTAPESGAAGTPLAFAAAPADAWSSVKSVTWAFSDGGTAMGDRVEHAFAVPGTYTATATATDALDNQASRSVEIKVVEAPRSPDLGNVLGDAQVGLPDARFSYRVRTRRARGRTRFTRFLVEGLSPAGRVEVRCIGRGCPLTRRAFNGRRRLDVARLLGGRRLRAGTVLEVRHTRSGRVGRVLRLTMRPRSAPSVVELCLAPGATRPGNCSHE
jgi:hypothetical protein